MLNESKTFNGSVSSGTVTYPNIYHPVYDEECPVCHGVGHTHCKDCGVQKRCEHCGGSGKKNVYEGNVYKIYWNVPYNPKPWEPHTTCNTK